MFTLLTNKESRAGNGFSLKENESLDIQALQSRIKEKKLFILLSGPTGVGKTDFAEYLVANLGYPSVIVNADMGQFYSEISIGTAKPKEINNCYLFNIIKEPRDFTVVEFRNKVQECLDEIWSSNKLPIIVGGSGFYLKSLFYLPHAGSNPSLDYKVNKNNFSLLGTMELYSKLAQFDPERAKKIHFNDRYRIERALTILASGVGMPSMLKPKFDPIGSCFYYFLNRDRLELRERISQRSDIMLKSGWIEEVKSLDESWRAFLLRKKLIGYPEIINYLENNGCEIGLNKDIAQKTWLYAKRQIIFWRHIKKELCHVDPNQTYLKSLQELNLTKNFEELKNIVKENLRIFENKN